MSNDEFTLDVGLALDLKMSFKRNGYSAEEVKELSKGDFLGRVREVMLGRSMFMPAVHEIDLDAAPFCPEGLFSTGKGTEHRKGGKLILTPGKIALFLAEGQKNGGWLKGHKLREELVNQPVLNANALDYMLAHQETFLEEWKGKMVFFWGTIYRGGVGGLYVRCAYWHGDRWVSGCDWLGNDFSGGTPAAVLASPAL
ncbi:hypothetical protein HY633_05435 [Candidatus Uhrbacteria bacterium]|nr:hypothetical protein [Candidatus Uhrbacteria bacterium]